MLMDRIDSSGRIVRRAVRVQVCRAATVEWLPCGLAYVQMPGGMRYRAECSRLRVWLAYKAGL